MTKFLFAVLVLCSGCLSAPNVEDTSKAGPVPSCKFPVVLGEIKGVACVSGHCTVCFTHECKVVHSYYAGCFLND